MVVLRVVYEFSAAVYGRSVAAWQRDQLDQFYGCFSGSWLHLWAFTLQPTNDHRSVFQVGFRV